MPKAINKDIVDINLLDDKTIGERISETRKSRGLTQQELAEKIGITRDLLCSYEIGRARIFGEMISKIALILEVSADKLLGIEDFKESNEKIGLRYTKRIKEIESLPEYKRRLVLKALDDSIKANKN